MKISKHEEELMEEIESLHKRLRKVEGDRIRWILISLGSFILIGLLLWLQFFR